MDPDRQSLTEHYLALLARTGQTRRWPDIQFDPTHDSDIHVEFDRDGAWSTVETDRGVEGRRIRHRDLHDLMFTLCARATWAAARDGLDAPPNTHAHEIEDRIVSRQAALMGRIDPKWAHQISGRHAERRPVRARQSARDRARERTDKITLLLVYIGSASIAGGAILLALYLG